MKSYTLTNWTIQKKKIDTFLETYNLPILNHVEIKKLSRPISKEIKSVNKNLPTKKKVQDQTPSPVNSIKNSKKNQYHFFSTLPKNRREGTPPNSVYETKITLIPDRDTMRKENYRPISLMNVDVKISSKILANQI